MKLVLRNQQFLSTKKNTKKLRTGYDYLISFNVLQFIAHRCEDYAISLLEQCEDLREVEIFLQTKYSGNKDANYILAILGTVKHYFSCSIWDLLEDTFI